MEINRDFLDLLTLFDAERVEYLIVGGYAVAHHGHPRTTGDIDLFVRPSDENAQRILVALDRFGFGSLAIERSDFNRPGRVLQLGYPPCRIDLVTSIDGLSFDEAAAEPSMGQYGPLTVPFIGRRQLLLNKRASGRPQDLADLDALSA